MEAARARTKQTPPFQLTREYQMFHGAETKPASEVTAEINVVPPHEREYRIVEAKGSNRGEEVVRKILEHESEAEKKDPPPTAVVSENYNFGYEGEQTFRGTRCYILSLHPKRKDPALVEGRAWVDANTFLIRKIEGEMSKSPSWWVKNVTLTILFGEIGGVWTQLSSDAIADVRLIGKYSVTGRALNLETATAEARVRRPTNQHQRRAVPAEAIYNPSLLVH